MAQPAIGSEMRECIDNCTECAQVCQECAAECIDMATPEMAACAQLCLDCFDTCITAGNLMSRRSKHHGAMCGVCAEVCPVEAIFFEDDLPEQWAAFKKRNADYFE